MFLLITGNEQLNQDEFDQIWEDMSTEIDIEEVWGDISTDLNVVMPENSGSGFIYISLAVLLIVLSALIPDIKEDSRKPDIHLTNVSAESGKNEQPSLKITNSKQGPINEEGKAVRDESTVIRENFEKIESENKLVIAKGKRNDPEQTIMIPISNEIVSKVLAAPNDSFLLPSVYRLLHPIPQDVL